jgi:hypothetical protein
MRFNASAVTAKQVGLIRFVIKMEISMNGCLGLEGRKDHYEQINRWTRRPNVDHAVWAKRRNHRDSLAERNGFRVVDSDWLVWPASWAPLPHQHRCLSSLLVQVEKHPNCGFLQGPLERL